MGTFASDHQKPKLQQNETERVKRKANTPPKIEAKKHQGYKSPDHAFNDEMIEDDQDNLEDKISAAEAGIN